MLVTTKTFSSDEYTNAEYDFMVVKIEEFEARILSGYLNLFDMSKRMNPTLLEMAFSVEDVEAEFFPCTIWEVDDSDVMPDELQEKLDDDNWAIIPEKMELPFTPRDAHLPEDVYLIVNEHGFFWRAHPYEGSLQIDSELLPRSILSQVI